MDKRTVVGFIIGALVAMALIAPINQLLASERKSKTTKGEDAQALAEECLVEIVGSHAFASASASDVANYCVNAAIGVVYAIYEMDMEE